MEPSALSEANILRIAIGVAVLVRRRGERFSGFSRRRPCRRRPVRWPVSSGTPSPRK